MSENTKIDFKKLLLAANIKQEPGVTPPRHNRLPSFKGVRDLNLNSPTSIAARPSLDMKPRKIFMPNLNVQRNKNKVDGVVGGLQLQQGRQQQQRQNRGRDGDRGRGRGRGRAILIQSTGGIFSEGASADTRRERASYGKGNSGAAADYIPKPKLNLNHKVDKQEEEQKLHQLLKDDFLDDPTLAPDSSSAPVTLPILCLANVKTEMKKEELDDSHDIFPGGMKIKKEKIDHDEKPVGKRCIDVKLAHLLDDNKAKFVLLQLPDTLPGLRAEETPKPSTAADPTPVSGEQVCVLRQLPEGQVGKLQVLKSGKVRLVLGKTVLNVFPGTEVSYQQVAVSADLCENSRGGDMINLGPVVDRLVCTPDWETLLNKCII